MTTRLKWFKADWHKNMRTLAKQLKSKQFTESSADGFVLDRVRDHYIEGRFIERYEYSDIVTDPFGKELTFHRVDFRQCEFLASTSDIGLELLNPPRGIQSMISRMLEATDFNLSISPITVDVMEWSSAFQKEAGISCIIDTIQINSIDLGSSIFAKAAIRGSTDVRNAGAEFVREKNHVLEKIQLRLPNNAKVVLTNAGTAKIDSYAPDELRTLLRASIPQPSIVKSPTSY